MPEIEREDYGEQLGFCTSPVKVVVIGHRLCLAQQFSPFLFAQVMPQASPEICTVFGLFAVRMTVLRPAQDDHPPTWMGTVVNPAVMSCKWQAAGHQSVFLCPMLSQRRRYPRHYPFSSSVIFPATKTRSSFWTQWQVLQQLGLSCPHLPRLFQWFLSFSCFIIYFTKVLILVIEMKAGV